MAFKDWMTVNNELERAWNEFKILSPNLPQRTEENHEKPVSIVGVEARIRIKYIYNANQNAYNLNQNVWGSGGIQNKLRDSARRSGRFYPLEKAPSTHQTGSWVRLGVRLDAMGKRTISACGENRTLVV
jgi:hypothetical protein